MRFLAKINRNYVALVGYFFLHRVIMDATKESLVERKNLIVAQIKDTGKIPNLYPIVEVEKLDRATGRKPGFKLIMIQNETENEAEPYLEYSEEINIEDSIYSLKLRQSSFENEDLVIIITFSFFMIILVSLGITFFISRKMNRTIWSEFKTNLEAVERFNFNGNQRIALVKSNIEEFDRLNRVIETLTKKLSADYLSLKEFTENASHEIQTPLSVALLHLDEVLQQDINEEAFSKTLAAIQALKRLSSLNQSLILLAKIDNRQFKAEDRISMNEIMERKLLDFEPLIKAKNLEFKYTVENDFRLKIHEQLADILLGNLLSNAINHNLDGGSIQLSIGRNELMICNTGSPNTLTQETAFNRFTKGDSKSYGLGLAMVKKICDTHDMEIRYTKNDLHCFTVIKKN
jgi:signal transduction histidine kinase